MLESSDHRIINQDKNGKCHFNGNFNNAESLKDAFKELGNSSSYGELVDMERNDFLEVFEALFNHKAFTGRSGTFFGFEGLGSIYWHMVSKLLLAVQENIYWAADEYNNTVVMGSLLVSLLLLIPPC